MFPIDRGLPYSQRWFFEDCGNLADRKRGLPVTVASLIYVPFGSFLGQMQKNTGFPSARNLNGLITFKNWVIITAIQRVRVYSQLRYLPLGFDPKNKKCLFLHRQSSLNRPARSMDARKRWQSRSGDEKRSQTF